MLHKETVKPGTLDLINRLMKDQQLNSFYLVGGTALALKLGHRESIDIDLFNSSDFDAVQLAAHLQKRYQAEVKKQDTNYITGTIGEVAFDIVTHKYPAIKQLDIIQAIRMMSVEDIAAMKVNAIVRSGSRLKDFIDIHYLLKEFTYRDVVKFFCQKYSSGSPTMARLSLLYHNNIDFNVPVKLMDKDLTWEHVKESICEAIAEYDRMMNFRWKRDDDNESYDRGNDNGGFSR